MAFSRKQLGSVQLGVAETAIYTAGASVTGTIGHLSFFNTSTSLTETITLYNPHSGAAGSDDILEIIVLGPRKTYVCRNAINKVVPGGYNISALTTTAATVNAFCDGGEE